MLADRNADTLRSLAHGLGLEWRAFGLELSPAQLQGIRAVMHAEGLFWPSQDLDAETIHDLASLPALAALGACSTWVKIAP